MTRPRRPSRPTFGNHRESWLESRLRQVIHEGDFMALEGAGKPLEDLNEPYDPDWWLKKMIRRERLSVSPAAFQDRQWFDQALKEAWGSRREEQVRQRLQDLNREVARRNATTLSGPSTTVAGVDVEAFVERWKRREPS